MDDLTQWMDVIRAIEGGALLICIVVLYKVGVGVLDNSKEDRIMFMDMVKNDLEKLAAAIDRLSDKIK